MSHQFTQRADELLVGDAVHVDLLLAVIGTGQTSEARVRYRLGQPVARERLLVRVRGPKTFLTVRHLAGDASLYGVLRRVLLAELTLDRLAR